MLQQIRPEWVSAFAGCIGAIGVFFVAFQVKIINQQVEIATKQLFADHERSGRSKALEVLEKWTSALDKAHPSARTLVKSFDFEQCQKLKSKKGFKIPSEKKSLLKHVLQDDLGDSFPQEEGEYLLLEDDHSAHIYFLCISHLNSLEVALQSWHLNIADEEMIESQFKYLIRPEKGHYILETMREVLGGKSCYPAIHEFVVHIKNSERKNEIKRKEKIV